MADDESECDRLPARVRLLELDAYARFSPQEVKSLCADAMRRQSLAAHKAAAFRHLLYSDQGQVHQLETLARDRVQGVLQQHRGTELLARAASSRRVSIGTTAGAGVASSPLLQPAAASPASLSPRSAPPLSRLSPAATATRACGESVTETAPDELLARMRRRVELETGQSVTELACAALERASGAASAPSPPASSCRSGSAPPAPSSSLSTAPPRRGPWFTTRHLADSVVQRFHHERELRRQRLLAEHGVTVLEYRARLTEDLHDAMERFRPEIGADQRVRERRSGLRSDHLQRAMRTIAATQADRMEAARALAQQAVQERPPHVFGSPYHRQ